MRFPAALIIFLWSSGLSARSAALVTVSDPLLKGKALTVEEGKQHLEVDEEGGKDKRWRVSHVGTWAVRLKRAHLESSL
jgi:hypothetical protein